MEVQRIKLTHGEITIDELPEIWEQAEKTLEYLKGTNMCYNDVQRDVDTLNLYMFGS